VYSQGAGVRLRTKSAGFASSFPRRRAGSIAVSIPEEIEKVVRVAVTLGPFEQRPGLGVTAVGPGELGERAAAYIW